jgi:hypothetical protein
MNTNRRTFGVPHVSAFATRAITTRTSMACSLRWNGG